MPDVVPRCGALASIKLGSEFSGKHNFPGNTVRDKVLREVVDSVEVDFKFCCTFEDMLQSIINYL